MKEVIPHKLVISYDETGKVKSSVLQYRMREDGVIQNKFYTMNVDNGMDGDKVSEVLSAAKSHAEKGEKINGVG